MIVLEDLLRDRGSRYAAAVGPVADRAGIDGFLSTLRARRKFAKATHHSWAAILPDGTPLKGDDGEAGAGDGVNLADIGLQGIDKPRVTIAAKAPCRPMWRPWTWPLLRPPGFPWRGTRQ